MKYILPLSTILFSLIFSTQSLASDNTELPIKLVLCQSCHGQNGMGGNALTPNIASQKKSYLVHELKAFCEKARIAPIMNHVSSTLTDAEIENLSTYYSKLNP